MVQLSGLTRRSIDIKEYRYPGYQLILISGPEKGAREMEGLFVFGMGDGPCPGIQVIGCKGFPDVLIEKPHLLSRGNNF